MGIKPASFFHEVTLLKKATQKTEVHGFRAFKGQTLQKSSAIEQLLFGFMEQFYIPASTNLVEYKKETGSSVVNRSATFHFPSAVKMIAAL